MSKNIHADAYEWTPSIPTLIPYKQAFASVEANACSYKNKRLLFKI